MKRVYITLTNQQREQLRPIFSEIGKCSGAVMAQVFKDGMHVVALPDETAKRVAEATGVQYLPKLSSGLTAYAEAVERDMKGGAK